MLGSTATGLSAGTTGVTATYSGLTGSATLTVTPVVIPPSGGGGGGGGYVPPIIPPSTLPSLDKIIVSPDPSSIAVGATQTYTATADYSDGSTTNVSDTATWSNSDTSIATMNGKVATGINGGSTIITATFNGKTGTATLNVTNIGEIKGQVREAVTSKPLAGADVLALGTDLVPVTVKTDENGDYEFDHLNFGNYVIALKVGDTFVIKMIVVQ